MENCTTHPEPSPSPLPPPFPPPRPSREGISFLCSYPFNFFLFLDTYGLGVVRPYFTVFSLLFDLFNSSLQLVPFCIVLVEHDTGKPDLPCFGIGFVDKTKGEGRFFYIPPDSETH